MSSNIVEAMFVQLGLDAGGYTEDAKKAVDQNNRLEKSLSNTEKQSASSGKSLDVLKGSLGSVVKGVAGLAAAIAVGTGLAKLAEDARKANDELYFLEKNLGMSAQSMKAWQGAAAASGGSAEAMTSTIKNLSKSMNDLVVMGDASMLPYFNAMGVGMVDANGKARDMNEVLLDMSDSLSQMDRQQAYSLASSMGLDDGTINTLLQGKEAMQEMLDIQNQMYKSSEKDLENSRELSKQQAIMNSHWNSMKQMIGDALVPIMTKLVGIVNRMFEFMQKHQKTVKNVFEGAAIFIGMVFIPIMYSAATAMLAFIAPFAPFILVVAALAAGFILLYDDYKTWAEGGKSLFDWGYFSKLINDSNVSVDSLKQGFAFLLTGYTDWAQAIESGKEWLRLKGFIDENGVSVGSLIAGFKNLSSELISDAIPTLKGYASIIQKLFSGDFMGAKSEAMEMFNNFKERAVDAAVAVKDRVAGAFNIGMGFDQGQTSHGQVTQGATSGQGGDSGTIVKLIKVDGRKRVYLMSDGSEETRGDGTEVNSGTVAWRNNNPGNLKFGFKGSADNKANQLNRTREKALADAQKRYANVVDLDQFGNAIFATPEAGAVAKAKLLKTNHSNRTIPEMLKKYATDDYSGKTNYASYEATIFKEGEKRGLNLRGKKIGQMSSAEFEALATGMVTAEGVKSGVVSRSKPSTGGSIAASPSLQQASKETANAADHATANALLKSAKKCALYVNNALRAQGLKIQGNGHEVANNLLKSNQGFKRVTYDKNYVPVKGDVMSMPSYDPKKQGHSYGHVAIYDGKQWVSDFKQGNKYGNTGAAAQGYYNMIQKDPSKATIARRGEVGQASINKDAVANVQAFQNSNQSMQRGIGATTNNNQKTVDISMGDIKVYTASSTMSGVAKDAFNAFNNNANQLMTGSA